MSVEPSRVGGFELRRVAGSDPPEWRGEAVVHGVAYRLRADVRLTHDGTVLVGAVLWSPTIAREGAAS